MAKQALPSSREFFKKNKKKLQTADTIVHELHRRAVERNNCLLCANCCRSLGPAISERDIERMAKALRMKPSAIAEQYLMQDSDDNTWIFRSMPCPFLADDNYCLIYENRPKACREYPHTDRKRFYQIFNLSLKNTETCPIVYEVIEELKDGWRGDKQL